MDPYVWFPAAGLFVGGVFWVVNDLARRASDRRYARLQRENDRRNLRYNTWSAVARLGGER